jgi:hypothetical protein
MPRKKKSPVVIRVQISGVPFDMMRYDRAAPFSEADAGKLERVSNNTSDDPNDRIIDFVCYREGAPEAARWRSFNCVILDSKPY